MFTSVERRRALGVLATVTGAGLVAACGGPRTARPTAPAARTPAAPRTEPGVRLPAEVMHGPRNGHGIALTFHGAGDPRLADRVLRELESGGARVTVLAVGTWLDEHPAMARRILDGGHELGNHTQHHVDIDALGPAAAYAEIAQCAERLHKLTGSIGRWFRPSQTQHAAVQVKRLAAKAGYPTCLSYDLDSTDFRDPGPASVSRTVLAGTLTALPSILDGLRTRGLTPVTASTLLAS
jgi:peptidoglycan/xylan/chitin deacetylase (PgdA/CDA1 family)